MINYSLSFITTVFCSAVFAVPQSLIGKFATESELRILLSALTSIVTLYLAHLVQVKIERTKAARKNNGFKNKQNQ